MLLNSAIWSQFLKSVLNASMILAVSAFFAAFVSWQAGESRSSAEAVRVLILLSIFWCL